MLPQVNATLLAISGGSTTVEDYDQIASSSGPTIWSGNGDAYVDERIRTTFATGEGGQARQKTVTLYISSDLVNGSGDALELQTGQVVTYTYRGTTYSRKIMDWVAPYLPGINISEYVKLDLQPEPEEAVLDMQ